MTSSRSTIRWRCNWPTVLERLGQTPRFIAAALPLRVLQPRFSRYDGQGQYGNHVDNAIFPMPGTGQHLRSDVSSTLFLSDPDEYEGGELTIEDMFGQQRIKLPAGHLIVIPAAACTAWPLSRAGSVMWRFLDAEPRRLARRSGGCCLSWMARSRTCRAMCPIMPRSIC
jgi:predicted 2-oxoglutarate/Fe(II)-dependent dioxygenase YbiX